jgi:hypothetical protein
MDSYTGKLLFKKLWQWDDPPYWVTIIKMSAKTTSAPKAMKT